MIFSELVHVTLCLPGSLCGTAGSRAPEQAAELRGVLSGPGTQPTPLALQPVRQRLAPRTAPQKPDTRPTLSLAPEGRACAWPPGPSTLRFAAAAAGAANRRSSPISAPPPLPVAVSSGPCVCLEGLRPASSPSPWTTHPWKTPGSLSSRVFSVSLQGGVGTHGALPRLLSANVLCQLHQLLSSPQTHGDRCPTACSAISSRSTPFLPATCLPPTPHARQQRSAPQIESREVKRGRGATCLLSPPPQPRRTASSTARPAHTSQQRVRGGRGPGYTGI